MTEIERIKKEQEEKKKRMQEANRPKPIDRNKMITEDGTLSAFNFQDNYK